MIIPSIDLSGGDAVQLVGGEREALNAGDPRPLAREFGLVGEVAVVDLDGARGEGKNDEAILDLIRTAPCRVGGGIRTKEAALRWLNAGARKVVLGTAARPEVLEDLPRGRVVAALDARDDEVVIKGWREGTGFSVGEKMRELRPFVDHFLVTFVEIEGQLSGVDLERVRDLVVAADGARLTVAGGIRDVSEVVALDRMGVEAQVGMALYTKRWTLADVLGELLGLKQPSDLVPTVVTDVGGEALGLAWSSRESLTCALEERRGVYQSRKRGLWRKGETSGCSQDLVRVDLDCDRDCLRFTVGQRGEGFCHRGDWTCFGEDRGLSRLVRRLGDRHRGESPPGSYTRRLFEEEGLLSAKLVEEARELAEAVGGKETIHEAADLLFFTLATLEKRGVCFAAVEEELDRRALAVQRRGGDPKEGVMDGGAR